MTTESNIDSLELLRKFKKVISSDVVTRDFFKDKLEWTDARERDWKNDKIRVGVIGITSSGKSTLINAILGVDILSSAVAPSSGQLVCCSFGEELSACVRFSNGKTERLTGERFCTEALMEYSDERKNPKNEKQVISIEIQSPYFELGKDVVLIDSPGLDAYGLEMHEKITLETLVPTIDVCVYVTTMKTNSDRKAVEILNTVARYNCPLVMVQNMLDSVRPTPGGEKTAKQVAREHLQRLDKIVQESEVINKEHVKIIQISAHYAKQWRTALNEKKSSEITETKYKESNYEGFLMSVKRFLDMQKPQINSQRIQSVCRTLNECFEELEPIVLAKKENVELEFPFAHLKEELQENEKQIENIYDEIECKYEKDISSLLAVLLPQKEKREAGVIGQLKAVMGNITYGVNGKTEVLTKLNVKKYLEKTNDLVDNIGKELLDSIKKSNVSISKMAEELNIPDRDIRKPPSFGNYKELHLEKRIEEYEVYVDDDGFIAGAKRLFGKIFKKNWGKHKETRTKEVTDIEANRQNMLDRINKALEKYSEKCAKWCQDTKVVLAEIKNEISIRELSYNERKKANIEKEKLKLIYDGLIIYKKEIANVKIPQFNPNPEPPDNPDDIKPKEAEVTPFTEGLNKLAKATLRRQHQMIMKQFVRIENLSTYNAVVLGWDNNCIEEFMWQSGIKDLEIVNLSQENQLNIKSQTKRCVFILVNTIQFGAAQKQIYQLDLGKILTAEDYIVWVVQDFNELINSNSIGEGLSNMFSLQTPNNIKNKVWLIHENPLYNISFLEHQYEPKDSLNAQTEFLDYLREKYGVYCNEIVLKNISEIMRRVQFEKGKEI